MLKNFFINFPYVLRLEKTVRFESTDSSSKIRVHSPLSCQSKFFQLLIIPHREKSIRFLPMRRNQSLQNQLTYKSLKSNFQAQSSTRNKKFSKQHTSGNSVTVVFYNINLDFKSRYENSNNIERSNISI